MLKCGRGSTITLSNGEDINWDQMEKTMENNTYSKRRKSKTIKYKKLHYFHSIPSVIYMLENGFQVGGSSKWHADFPWKKMATLTMTKSQRQRWMGKRIGNWNQKQKICKEIYED